MEVISKADAADILRPHFGTLHAVLDGAWERWEALPIADRAAFCPRTRACIVHDFMREKAESAGGPRFRTMEKTGLFLVVVDKAVLLRFKKLSERGVSCNYPTQQALDFEEQMEIHGIGELPRLTVGYVLDRSGTEVVDFIISCPTRWGNTAWTMSFAGAVQPTSMLPIQTVPDLRSVVRPRSVDGEAETDKDEKIES